MTQPTTQSNESEVPGDVVVARDLRRTYDAATAPVRLAKLAAGT